MALGRSLLVLVFVLMGWVATLADPAAAKWAPPLGLMMLSAGDSFYNPASWAIISNRAWRARRPRVRCARDVPVVTD
jgi:hypothetical protein